MYQLLDNFMNFTLLHQKIINNGFCMNSHPALQNFINIRSYNSVEFIPCSHEYYHSKNSLILGSDCCIPFKDQYI